MPMRISRLPVRALVACAVLAAPASARAAREPQPLVDRAPGTAALDDRVLTGTPSPRAPAPDVARAPRAAGYVAPDGQSVEVAFSAGYVPNPTVAQSYVTFLGGLPHGTELSKLKLRIATPSETLQLCGGRDGTLACYSTATGTMTVPGEEIADGRGLTTSYVLAHEYGHHVAQNRNATPFRAVAYGPRYWSSYQRVCQRALAKEVFPGDEGPNYLRNPGEAWAETYARLVYPTATWTFSGLLAPDATAYEMARKDVLTPWTASTVRTFSGRFGPRSRHTRRFRFTLTLDGAMSMRLRGPRGADYDLTFASGGKVQQRTRTRGSRDVISYPDGACRERATETIEITVTRRHGAGPFTVRVAYAG